MPAASTPLIEVKDVKQRFDDHWVLNGIDLTINKGEIVGIIGGSGCGKTTLLRNILMLLPFTEGSIKIFGTDIQNCSAEEALSVQHRWGMLFQHNALFSSLTVAENVQFPLNLFTKVPENLQKHMSLIKVVMSGLPVDAAFKYPAELSGGMQKRAALARAIAMDPELLFLDEPTAGLDPQSAEAFGDLIHELHDGLGLTVVMVTHDIPTLRRISHRVAFLGKGKVLAYMPLAELEQQPDPMIQAYFGRDTKGKEKNGT